MQKQDLATPALLLDLDVFEANLQRMAARARSAGKALRPHFKAHKCPEIARRQVAAGAVGVCVATLAELELVVEAGIPSALLTSPMADPAKAARVARTGAMAVIDHPRQAAWYDAAAQAAGTRLEVLIDLDVGDHRTGARPEDAAPLAEAIAGLSHLRLRGIQAYSVHGSHAGGYEARLKTSTDALAIAAQVRDHVRAAGHTMDILTGGSTGTWLIDTQIEALTELQAGSYVLMDMAYGTEGLAGDDGFGHALTVLGTVVSANHRSSDGSGFVTLDCGTKSFSTDRGYGPRAARLPGTITRWGGDEFLYLEGSALPQLGDKVEFIPPHCDPTCNLYTQIHACRGEEVVEVWPLKRLKL